MAFKQGLVLYSHGSISSAVHPTDPVRLDLKIPPENHMYLRAASSGERQQWLVALGTAKACRVDTSYQEHQQQSMFFIQIFDATFVSLILLATLQKNAAPFHFLKMFMSRLQLCYWSYCTTVLTLGRLR